MPPPPSASELQTYLFGAPDHPLIPAFLEWAKSPLFRSFANTYRDKIRKKLRGARDDAGLDDIAWELEVAARLLASGVFTVQYEQGGVGVRRGPDFAALFKGHTPIGIEATRMRGSAREPNYAATKLGDIVMRKLEQTIDAAPNVLVVRAIAESWPNLDPGVAMLALFQHAEQRDDPFFAQRGLTDAREFRRAMRRLSGVLVTSGGIAMPSSAVLWLNHTARRPLPDEARKRLLTSFQNT